MNYSRNLSLRLIFMSSVFGLAACVNSTSEAEGKADEHYCRIEAIKRDFLVDHSRGILVAAHRGHHIKHPENSISAIASAAEIEADIVEIDVLLSKDGVPVLMHDETLDRTTDGSGRVDALTYAELKELRLRTSYGKLTDERIPSLQEALRASRGKIFVDVDLKSIDVEPIVAVIESESMINHVMFYNADLSVRDAILELAPDAIVMPIAREREDVERILDAADLQVLHLRETYNSPALAAALDRRRVAGWTNALGAADEIVRSHGASLGFDPIIANRPDIIQTDLPEELIEHLIERKLHWTVINPACQDDPKPP